MTMMAGRPAENEGKLSVCTLSVLSAVVESHPQSAADVERSLYQAAWREAMMIELVGPKTTGTYEAAIPPQGRKSVGAQWVLTDKTHTDCLIVRT